MGDNILLAFAKNEGREHSYFVLWNKIFKSSILKSVAKELLPIAKNEGRYNFSEDALISFFAFKFSKSIANIHTGYYFYRTHSEQSVNVVSAERLESHIKYMSKTFDIMLSNIGNNIYKKEIENSLKKWIELMSRTHYSHAKANKYCHLYPKIKESYRVDKLRISTYHDNSAYSKNKVLPLNIEEIEQALISLWKKDDESVIALSKTDAYIKSSIEYMREHGKNIKISESGEKFPIPRVKLKDRIIMNKAVYTLGLIFFKKGSKIRAFLKRHI